MANKKFAILAVFLCGVASPWICEAQELPFGLKLGQSRQQVVEVLQRQGIQPDLSDGVAGFRGDCGSMRGFWSMHFSGEGIGSVQFTTGTISPKQQSEFLKLVPLVEGCYRILDTNLQRAHGAPIAGGQLSKTESDRCFAKDGVLIRLKSYIVGSPEQYTADVREAISAMRGKVARVTVGWERLRKQMLPAIDMSDACATAVNRLLLQSPQSRSPEGESGFVQVRQGFGGFETVAVGVLRDPKSGLEWTATDNGRDINWADASAYCTKRGRGWRLPTADELLNLNDGSGVMQTRCGHDTCYVSSNFRLTSNSFWSGTRNGPSEAWIVLLFRRDFSRPVRDDNLRALCVRRP